MFPGRKGRGCLVACLGMNSRFRCVPCYEFRRNYLLRARVKCRVLLQVTDIFIF